MRAGPLRLPRLVPTSTAQAAAFSCSPAARGQARWPQHPTTTSASTRRAAPAQPTAAATPGASTTTSTTTMTVELGSAPREVSTAPIGHRKLRILCLHGYLQNAEIFRSRIGSLRKALKSRAEFFFVDAPYPVAPEAADQQAVADSGGDSGVQGRSWWQWSDLEPGTRPSRAAHYTGWAASQAAIEAALVQHAPIDGLLGFSQGATAAALFLAHAQPGQLDGQQQAVAAERGPQQVQQAQQLRAGSVQQAGPPLERREQGQEDGAAACETAGANEVADSRAGATQCCVGATGADDHLRFAVVIAGFLPRDAGYAAALRSGRPALPSLHVHGAADELVPEERSAALWGCFAPGCVQTYKHPGAHMVPTCSGDFKQALVALLDDVKAGRLQRPKQQQQQQQQGVKGADAASLPAADAEEAALAGMGALACR